MLEEEIRSMVKEEMNKQIAGLRKNKTVIKEVQSAIKDAIDNAEYRDFLDAVDPKIFELVSKMIPNIELSDKIKKKIYSRLTENFLDSLECSIEDEFDVSWDDKMIKRKMAIIKNIAKALKE